MSFHARRLISWYWEQPRRVMEKSAMEELKEVCVCVCMNEMLEARASHVRLV